MYTATKKLRLIERVLKIKNETILNEIEALLNSRTKKDNKEFNIYDFVGILSKKEAADIRKTIAETCETIDEYEWK